MTVKVGDLIQKIKLSAENHTGQINGNRDINVKISDNVYII